MSPTRLTGLILSLVVLVASGCGSSSSTTSNNSNAASNTSTGNPPTSSTSTSISPASNNPTGSSSTGSNEASSTPLNRTVLTTNANAICKRAHTQLMGLATGNTQNVEQIYSKAATYERTALTELQKLSPPTELAKDWKQIVSAVGTLADDSTKYAEYASTKNLSKSRELAEAYGTVKRPAVAVATHDGLTGCAILL
jgi:hypothetical protein